MSFSFTTFKAVSGVTDAEEAKYALVMKSIFDILLVQYEIDLNNLEDIPYALQNAVYEHAVFLFQVSSKNLRVLSSVTDTNGNKTSYSVETPKDIISIYKLYSPTAPALL